MGEGRRGGIGLGLAEPLLSVQYIVAGSPADESGFFDEGDLLVSVDKHNVEGLRLKEVVPLIVGEEGTPVKIGMLKGKSEKVEYITLFRKGSKKPPEKQPERREPEEEKEKPPDVLSTLKFKGGDSDDEPKEEDVVIENPVFKPGSGHHFKHNAMFQSYTIDITCNSPPEADVYYTTDGRKPSAMRPGTLYAGGGVQIRENTTVHAIARLKRQGKLYMSDVVTGKGRRGSSDVGVVLPSVPGAKSPGGAIMKGMGSALKSTKGLSSVARR